MRFLSPTTTASITLFLAACGGGAQDARPRPGVLITLDTTNPDALDVYGQDRGVTPNLARLAADCVVYDRARSVAPLTTPAHGSMLTGLYPPRHTVRDNGYLALPESADTLAERARAAGYRTAAFVAAAVLGSQYGLDQGFEHFDEAPRRSQRVAGVGERSAPEVTNEAIRWLQERKGTEPYFLWVHYYDPHLPYAPPPEFLARTDDQPYLGEVAWMDAAVGVLLERLRQEPDWEQTTVVVVADHGEALGRHREQTHGLLAYDATLLVPMMVRFPDRRRAGSRSDATVSVVDVFPTMLASMGLGAPDGRDGIDLSRGDPPADRGVYFECYYAFLNYGWSPLAGWADAEGKYIHGTVPELFDPGDIGEEHNRFEPDDPRVARARRAIQELAGRPVLERAATEAQVTSTEVLQELGYAASGSALAAVPHPLEDRGLPAPQENLNEHFQLWEALTIADSGRLDVAIRILEQVTAANPRNSFAHDRLGDFLIQAKRPREALVPLQAMIDRGLERPTVRLKMAGAYAELREYDRAFVQIERYMELCPEDAAVGALRDRIRAAAEAADGGR